MAATIEGGFALASSPEEVALRRKLLFRLLRDFDFARPKMKSEFITDPIRRMDQPHSANEQR